MLKKKKKNKIIFLKNIFNYKIKFNFNKSIIHNNECFNNYKIFNCFFFNKKKKKNCIFGISSKYVHKKYKISRFALININSNNFNQNFKKIN